MLVLDRLTDPLAVQRGVVQALSRSFPGATLELMRVQTTPPEALIGAKEIDPALGRAVMASEYVTRQNSDVLDGAARRALVDLGADLLVPVRCGTIGFGVLRIDHRRIDRSLLVHACRFADLLGLKLETHRLYAEVESSRRLAALGTLASGLAHDLRTPLSSIRMNLQMLQMDPERLGADIECVEIAIAEADRMNAYIDTLLEFARPLTFDIGAVAFPTLVEDAKRQVLPLAMQSGVRLVVQLPAELPTISGSACHLERVLVNLLQNAVQASAAQTTVELVGLLRASTFELVVRDQGRGIADADLPRLFDPFFTTRSHGIGLGLAICRKIVEAHRGTIVARQRSTGGADFRIRLPLRDVAASGVRQPREHLTGWTTLADPKVARLDTRHDISSPAGDGFAAP
jgi:signal transduction histidine kinase